MRCAGRPRRANCRHRGTVCSIAGAACDKQPGRPLRVNGAGEKLCAVLKHKQSRDDVFDVNHHTIGAVTDRLHRDRADMPMPKCDVSKCELRRCSPCPPADAGYRRVTETSRGRTDPVACFGYWFGWMAALPHLPLSLDWPPALPPVPRWRPFLWSDLCSKGQSSGGRPRYATVRLMARSRGCWGGTGSEAP